MDCPVGNTDVAEMQESRARVDSHMAEEFCCDDSTGGVSTECDGRSAGNLVSVVLMRSCAGLGASASITKLVESLIWPFVVFRSKKREWFTDKELGRFVRSCRSTAKRLIEVESEDNREQTYMKFWLDTHLCQVFKDPQRPVKDEFIVNQLFCGWMKRCVARAIARRDVSFIYSLQKGTKKLWPALGDVKRRAALVKHQQRLSTPHGRLPFDLERMIVGTSQEVFTDERMRQQTRFMPSGSACFQRSLRKGGALSLYDSLTLHPNSVEAQSLGKLRYLDSKIVSWRNTEFARAYSTAKSGVLNAPLNNFSSAEELARGGILGKSIFDVKVVAIPEPGKFRVITKGDGYLYTALQPLQGSMLDAWKVHPSSTMLFDDLECKVNEIDKSLNDPEFHWCSVDYEAATDLMLKECSVAIMRDLNFRKVAFADLGAIAVSASGRAIYPDDADLETTIVNLLEGQLMGHPLSFPMLCVSNLAVYRCALLRWVRKFPEHRKSFWQMWRAVIVNGDDMLFKAPRSLYEIFLTTAAEAGFKISQGKNYYSKDCCMINSQVFRRKGGKMQRQLYLNLKFLCNGSIKDGDSNATPTGIARDLSKMCLGLPVAKSIIPAVMKRWQEDFKWVKPNWYLPRHLGGFGLDISLAPYSSWRVTKDQRRVASRFLENPKLKIFEMEGVSKSAAIVAGALANWKVVKGAYVPTRDEALNRDEWLARFCYASRAAADLDQDSDLKGLYKINHMFYRREKTEPLSWDDLFRNWQVQLFAAGLPTCPPIGLIRRKEMRTSVAAAGSNGVMFGNSPKRYSSWLELEAHYHPEFNNSVLTKMPRDYTAPPVLSRQSS